MKILKHKNIMGIIYSLLLLMPIAAIGVRSAYVICNKNAYQSYYGETVNEVNYEQVTTFTDNNDYLLRGNNSTAAFTANITFTVSSVELLNGGNYDVTNVNNGFFYYNTGTSKNFVALREDNTAKSYIPLESLTLKMNNLILSSSNESEVYPYLYTIEYNNYSYLDNVFEYSVNKFVSENNLGHINLFSWFTNLFLSDNATNNLYVGFANWYMNYAMLISCMHLLFLVLMWFVNYSRRLLDRGMNYDW